MPVLPVADKPLTSMTDAELLTRIVQLRKFLHGLIPPPERERQTALYEVGQAYRIANERHLSCAEKDLPGG